MTTRNFADKTIWTGDNLDILRGLDSDTVDLIYLDPPFNSNRNCAAPVGSKGGGGGFPGAAFKDTWELSDLDVAWMGLIANEQSAFANLLHTASLTHGKRMQSYLTMMAARLVEMRRVPKDTGSIYLHCDPTVSHYLKAPVRPPLRRYPSLMDATAEEMARAMFALPVDHQWEYKKDEAPTYQCTACGQAVFYPETLYRDGRCEGCRIA